MENADQEAQNGTGNNALASRSVNGIYDRTPSQSKYILSFPAGDPENPYNWPQWKKLFVVLLGTLTVLNSTLDSSLPSGAIPQISAHFKVHNEEELVLPNSIYLVGYMLGPLLFAPLSERYGRKVIVLSTFAGLTAFTLGICLAPNWPAFIIFRLIKGIFGATFISVVGGLYADVYESAEVRGRAIAIFMTTTLFGPLIGPIASGYLGPYGWQWPFWFSLIFAGATCVPLAFLPETFGPTLLHWRAKKMRKRDPNANVVAPIEISSKTLVGQMQETLYRPFDMLFHEAIVFFASLYLALVFAILFLFFQAYPLIFPPIYGFNLGEQGLALLAIGIGGMVACSIYLYWDKILANAKAHDKPWSRQEEYRRLPLACIGGPFLSIGCFWIGWSARTSVHWIVPVLGGVPWGIGYLLLFFALLNYLVDSYGIYSASALAASQFTRSFLGAVLPLATGAMYSALGIAWACSLLGFVSAAMCLIPFAFIKYGDRIRARSRICQELMAAKEREKQDGDVGSPVDPAGGGGGEVAGGKG